MPTAKQICEVARIATSPEEFHALMIELNSKNPKSKFSVVEKDHIVFSIKPQVIARIKKNSPLMGHNEELDIIKRNKKILDAKKEAKEEERLKRISK